MSTIEEIKNDNLEEDIDDPEFQTKSSLFIYKSVKIGTILFAIPLIIQFIYYTVTELKDIENDDFKNEKAPVIILALIRLPLLFSYTLMLYIENNLNNLFVAMIVLFYPFVEVVVTLFSVITIDYRRNIIGLILQLIFIQLTFNLSLSTLTKLLSSRTKEMKKEEEAGNKQEKTTETSETKTAALEKEKQRRRHRLTSYKVFKHNFAAISAMFAVAITSALGFLLRFSVNQRFATIEWSESQQIYIGFLGQLFLRAVSCLIIPLLLTSLVFTIAAMNLRKSYKIAIRACMYFLITTVMAVLLGNALVIIICPGICDWNDNSTQIEEEALPLNDALLDLLRNLIPDNIIQSTFQTYKTKPNNTQNGSNKDIENWSRKKIDVNKTNFLGLITVAIVLGLAMSLTSKQCGPLINTLGTVNRLVVLIIEYLAKLTPIFIIFLILPQILKIKDFVILQKLGLFVAIVLLGLLIHMSVVLPLIYFIVTKKNPFKFMYNLSSALIMAFTTTSSVATMPIIMKSLEENNFINEKVIQFCIPISASLSIDGTALYAGGSAIFICQSLGKSLSNVELFIVTLTTILASIGAAGVSQSGLIIIVILLNVLDVPIEEVAIVMFVDCLLDRFRIVVNIMGNAFGTGIVHKLVDND